MYENLSNNHEQKIAKTGKNDRETCNNLDCAHGSIIGPLDIDYEGF